MIKLTVPSFLILAFSYTTLIYLWKPRWMCTRTKGRYVVSTKLLISFSLSLASLTAILFLMLDIKTSAKPSSYSTTNLF